MSLSEGSTVPADITFVCRVRNEALGGDNPFEFKNVTTGDLFKGIVFDTVSLFL